MKKHTRHLLLLLSLLPWGPLHGQGGYPVNCQAVLSPGGTLSWSGLTSPGGGLRVRLRLRDGGEAQVRAYLRFSLERVGLVIRSRPGYVGTVPVDLPFGVPVEVGGEALSEMFRPGNVEVSSAGGALDAATLYRGGRLPFGLYTLRVTAYEHGGARGHRQLSNEGLALMAVFQGHPPVLNHPVGGRVLPAREPANILFQWTPRGTASRGGGAEAYEMELYAVPEGMHAAWAVGNSSPIFTGVSDRPSLAYGQGFGHPQLEAGRRYAWRVRVRGLSGPESYGNGGYSNVGSFRYGPPCSPPENLEAEPRGDWGYTLTWDPSPAALSYRLRYRPEGSGGWGGGAASLEPYLGFSRPLVGQRYEFEVAAVCSGVQTSGWAGTPRVEKAGEGEPPPPGAGRPLTEGPGLSRLLDPWGILASSSGQGEGSQAYKELEAGLAVLPNGPRCGGPVDNTLACEPAGGPVATGPPFTFAPGREMFINGYKVTVVGGDASAGRGLLHYPWLGRSLPVEWKGITAVRGEEGQGHGCVTAGQLEVTGGQDGGLASDYRRAVQDLLTSGTGEYSGTLREAAGLVSAQGDSLAVGENINWALSGKAMSALGGGLGEWRGKVEGHFSQGGGTPPPEVRAVLDSLSAMQGKLNALAACVVRNIPASAGGELAPLRLEEGLFACQLGGADIAFMQGLEGKVGELGIRLAEHLHPGYTFYALENGAGNCPEAGTVVGDLIRLPLVGKVNVWLYKLPPECLKLSDLNEGFSLEGIDFDLGDIEIDFWEGLKDMGKGFAESLYFEKDPKDEKKVILRSEGQKVAAITLESKEKAEELVNISQQTHKASFPVTGGQLKEIFPNTPQARCDEVAALLNKYSDEYGLTSPERMAHFIGQIGAETQLKNLDEGSYSASRILTAEKTRTTYSSGGKRYLKYCSLFEGYSRASTGCPYPKCDPKIEVPIGQYNAGGYHYASTGFMNSLPSVKPAMVDELPRDSEFFSTIYACQLNNGGIESGDGYRFRGRGFIQITGYYNYSTMVQTKWDAVHGKGTKDFMCRSTGCDKNLDAIAKNLDFSMLISLTFWKEGKNGNTNNIANSVDDDSIRKVTVNVNGAENGLSERINYTKKAYEILKK